MKPGWEDATEGEKALRGRRQRCHSAAVAPVHDSLVCTYLYTSTRAANGEGNSDSASTNTTTPTMTDFLQRESDVLGEEFGTPTGGTYATADIDFDRAASAFPEISLDGTDDFSAPPPAAPPTKTSGSFSFDDFSSPPPSRTTEVKVTGDDEIDKFESEFPDIEVPQVRAIRFLLPGRDC